MRPDSLLRAYLIRAFFLAVMAMLLSTGTDDPDE
jgi:hypothetical protein